MRSDSMHEIRSLRGNSVEFPSPMAAIHRGFRSENEYDGFIVTFGGNPGQIWAADLLAAGLGRTLAAAHRRAPDRAASICAQLPLGVALRNR